jgi:hypothetical protein
VRACRQRLPVAGLAGNRVNAADGAFLVVFIFLESGIYNSFQIPSLQPTGNSFGGGLLSAFQSPRRGCHQPDVHEAQEDNGGRRLDDSGRRDAFGGGAEAKWSARKTAPDWLERECFCNVSAAQISRHVAVFECI